MDLLQVQVAKGQVKEFKLQSDRVVIGRSDDADLVVPDSRVLRHHAALKKTRHSDRAGRQSRSDLLVRGKYDPLDQLDRLAGSLSDLFGDAWSAKTLDHAGHHRIYRRRLRMCIGPRNPLLPYPATTALYPISVRRVRSLPPASFPPYLATPQFP